MPDSGKFKDLYLNSTHTYPCQPRARGTRIPHFHHRGLAQLEAYVGIIGIEIFVDSRMCEL